MCAQEINVYFVSFPFGGEPAARRERVAAAVTAMALSRIRGNAGIVSHGAPRRRLRGRGCGEEILTAGSYFRPIQLPAFGRLEQVAAVGLTRRVEEYSLEVFG